MYRLNKLNHFTTYETLLKILKNGLRFTDNFDNWDDDNDSELVKLYIERHNDNPENKVGIICFMNDDETIYHWTYFSRNTCVEEACCIEFDKDSLLKEAKHLICREVQYDTINDVSFDQDVELLFTKRWPYRNEREFRIARVSGDEEFFSFNNNEVIQKITLSGKLSLEEFCQRRDYLRNTYNLTCEINHSTIFRNERWISKAKKIIGKNNMNICVKEAEYYSSDEIEQFKMLLCKGEQVDMHNIDKLLNRNPILAMLYEDNKIVSIGGLKTPICQYKHKVFDNAKSNEDSDEYTKELGWIYTEEEYRKKGYSRHIIESLLAKNNDRKIYATTQENNSTMRKLLEYYDFCVSGNQYPSERGNYNLRLYIRKK